MQELITWLEETAETLLKNRQDTENQRVEATNLGFILQGRAEAVSAIIQKCKELSSDSTSTESGGPAEKETVNS